MMTVNGDVVNSCYGNVISEQSTVSLTSNR